MVENWQKGKGDVKMKVVNEHKIGITKNTEIEKEVQNNFEGECKEVGMYLAMARQAQREGLPEVAEVLKELHSKKQNMQHISQKWMV